jgi:acetylornithine deacetylase/succinyl-diaminopimelate desuccinylase-like protein
MADLREETTRVLQQLIRFNTVNPPGHERACQEWLAAYLSEAGFDVELLGAEPERPNLIARLRGEQDGPTFAFLSHVDTVLATPGDWTHDPWSGDVADGYVWGRGAIDMKSQTAAEVVAAAELARSGWRPKHGELLVLAVVDEEVGGTLGAEWLCEHHPDKVRCDFMVNEGGGVVIPYEERRLYGVSCAEKGTFRFAVSTDGVAGHASLPRMGENALLKLAPLVQRLGGAGAAYDVTEYAAAFLRAVGEDPDDPRGAVARMGEADPRLAVLVEPMLGVTFSPTIIAASEKINVIPAHAELKVDCRVPPGLDAEAARARVEEVIGGEGYGFRWLEEKIGNGSPADSPLMDAIVDWLGEADPSGEAVPTMLPAFTDSRTFRAAFPDLVAYGFFPQRHMDLYETSPLIHGKDERIDVRDLGFAADCFAGLARRLLG